MRRNGDGDVDYQCLECPDTQVCMRISGQTAWENNWCYLKDPAVNYASLGLSVNQERLPTRLYQHCINCMSSDIPDAICTFATNYFTT